jgi:hypothetical protein
MGWFTDYTAAPIVIHEQANVLQTFSMMWGDPPDVQTMQWQYRVVFTRKSLRCLTYEAAQTAFTFYNAQTGVVAVIKRLDETGQYGLDITEETATLSV